MFLLLLSFFSVIIFFGAFFCGLMGGLSCSKLCLSRKRSFFSLCGCMWPNKQTNRRERRKATSVSKLLRSHSNVDKLCCNLFCISDQTQHVFCENGENSRHVEQQRRNDVSLQLQKCVHVFIVIIGKFGIH